MECPMCKGYGVLPRGPDGFPRCPECYGDGTIEDLDDIDTQEEVDESLDNLMQETGGDLEAALDVILKEGK